MVKFHGEMDKVKFWLDWFGIFNRELGTNRFPHRNWTDNPNDLIAFIKMCASEAEEGEFCRPCWITAQPMRFVKEGKYGRLIGIACAIEKLFYDFDDDCKYCSKCDEYINKDDLLSKKEGGKKIGSLCPECETICVEKPRLELIAEEVKKFLADVDSTCKSQRHPFGPEPFVVKTRKGYHVYYWLRQTFKFNPSDFDFAKEVYEEIQRMIISKNYQFMDNRIIGDLNRFARVPLTAHEKTGAICQILDRNLEPTKVRNLDFYRTYGIPTSAVKKAINSVKKKRRDAYQEAMKQMENAEKFAHGENGQFQGRIRPCFQKRMDKGEMNHAQRLAWLFEIYYAGYKTEEVMVELCKCFSDFTDKDSRKQVRWFLKREKYTYPPYRCKTIMGKGWCIEEECPIWQRKYKN